MSHRVRQPKRLLTSLVGALLLTTLFSIAAASKAAAVQPGVVSDLSWGISATDKLKTADAMADAGVRWTRIGLGWRNLEPSKGSYSNYHLQEQDAAVAAARSAGVKVILDVVESPQWASGSTNKLAPPRNPQDLADFMAFITNRYKGQVQAYEIWNEENGSRFWPAGPNAGAYTRLLKATYPAIKSADPSALVVFGGLANADYHYVEAAYAAGAKGYFDVMGVHPYSCWAPSAYYYVDSGEHWVGNENYSPKAGERVSMYDYLAYREVHKSMVAAGDAKPIWFTEMGWSSASTGGTCVVDEQTQASYLTQAYKMAEQDSYVQVGLWYNLREDYWSTGPSYWDGGFGLLRKDFSPKPAYYAFRTYAAGQGSTTTPPPTTTTPPPATTTPPPTTTTTTTTTTPTTTTPPPTTTTRPTKHKKRVRRSAKRLKKRR